MRLDRQGRLLIRPLGLCLGLEDGRAVCYDAETGDRLGDYAELDEARRAAEQRIQDEQQARLAAEQRTRQLEAELRRARVNRPSD
jgi:hypothetical protein